MTDLFGHPDIEPTKRYPWFFRVMELDASGHYVEALGIIFSQIDDMLCGNQFSSVDEFLKSIDLEKISSHMIVGILSITRPASALLATRRWFYNSAWERLNAMGKDANRLIGGLRGVSYG